LTVFFLRLYWVLNIEMQMGIYELGIAFEQRCSNLEKWEEDTLRLRRMRVIAMGRGEGCSVLAAIVPPAVVITSILVLKLLSSLFSPPTITVHM
jgi:hypothetical protein